MDDAPPVPTDRTSSPSANTRRPDMRTAAESRTRTANDPLVLQLMQRAEGNAQGNVKPKAIPPGLGLPTGGGGFPIPGAQGQGGPLPQLGKMPKGGEGG